MDEAVEVRLAERLPRGLDDVLADTNGRPSAEAVGGLDEHAYRRIGAMTLVEDSHLVIDELEFLDCRIRPEQRVAYGVIKGIDRTVALPDYSLAQALGREPYGAFSVST